MALTVVPARTLHLNSSSYLKGQFIGSLCVVALDNVSGSDGRNIDGRFFMHKQMVPFIIDLVRRKQNQSDPSVYSAGNFMQTSGPGVSDYLPPSTSGLVHS